MRVRYSPGKTEQDGFLSSLGSQHTISTGLKGIKLNASSLVAAGKVKVKESNYPFLTFHLLRCAQLIASMSVSSIMAYFLWWLSHDGYPMPWTFILLLAVSIFTILTLSTTIAIHSCYGLNPRLSLSMNAAISIIWSVAFSLLSWWNSRTLGHACNRRLWTNDNGIMICRFYKTLFAFTVLGLLSTLGATILDFYVLKNTTQRGRYDQMRDLDHKNTYPVNANSHAITSLQDMSASTTASYHLDSTLSPSTALGRAPARAHHDDSSWTRYANSEDRFTYDTVYRGAGMR